MAQSWQWLKTSVFSVDLPPYNGNLFIILGFSREMDTSGFVEFLHRQSK